MMLGYMLKHGHYVNSTQIPIDQPVAVKKLFQSVDSVLCPGGGSLSGVPPDIDLPYGEERAVCILLECFPVWK